jgi:hypothetical protein
LLKYLLCLSTLYGDFGEIFLSGLPSSYLRTLEYRLANFTSIYRACLVGGLYVSAITLTGDGAYGLSLGYGFTYNPNI